MQGPVHTIGFEALSARVGQEIGVAAWTTIDQPMIDAFARLTGDQHFIHVDPVRAAAVLPSSTQRSARAYRRGMIPDSGYCP